MSNKNFKRTILRKARNLSVLMGSVLAAGFVAWNQLQPEPQATIQVDSEQEYQTIFGWEAMAYAADWPGHSAAYPGYLNELFHLAVDDLGINRVRLEIYPGAENSVDYGAQFLSGQITEGEYIHSPGYAYQMVNDNPDPDVIDAAGFHFTWLDHIAGDLVEPMRQRVAARGERLFITLTHVGFSNDPLFSDNPAEFAEFILAAFQHLEGSYGWVPDAVEVLEPHNGTWDAAELAAGFVAAGDVLKAHGYTPGFVGPSHASMGSSVAWFDTMVQNPRLLDYLTELSYHRYADVNGAHLQALADRGVQYGIDTAMLEHMGSPYAVLHEDLKVGRNSAWSGAYSLAGKSPNHDLYRIDDSNPSQPRVIMNEHTKFYRQYFKYIRSGALRIGATTSSSDFDPLAFINPDGTYVVVVLAKRAGTIAIQNLGAGRYGIAYTTVGEFDVRLPDVELRAGEELQAEIPDEGIVTIFVNGRNLGSGAAIATAPLPKTPTPGIEASDAGSNVPGAAPDFRSSTERSTDIAAAVQDQSFQREVLRWIRRLQPNQGGTIWLSFFLTISIAFDVKRPKSWRNLDLILLLLPALLLFDVITLGDDPSGLNDPARRALFSLLFAGLLLVTGILLARTIRGAFERRAIAWQPNLPRMLLLVLLVILLLTNVFVALARAPDDAGNYTNLGAYRFGATGSFPYGDPQLRGGAASTYGPLLYVAHLPFQWGVTNFMSWMDLDENALARRVLIGTDNPDYEGPPVMATKMAVLAFHLVGVGALVAIGWKLAGPSIGLALGCLYAGSAYVLGIGGEELFITGLTFISHIAPTALTLLAFLSIKRPLVAGALLAAAAGTLFYPFFLFPLWLGYYLWRRNGWVRFALGFVVVSSLIFGATLLLTQSTSSESALAILYESTVGHQESKAAYGSSTFSFWGTQPNLASFWQQPLIDGWYLLRPSFLLFLGFLGLSFFLARGRTVSQLALLTASVVIAIQLWKSHAGGTYVEWYFPFLLIGFLTSRTPSATASEAAIEASMAR